MAGADFSEEMNEVFQLLLDEVAKDIFKQNKRFGGNMAVAHAVFSRTQRKALRKILGSECVFIVLNMSRDCQKKRVLARYGNTDCGLFKQGVQNLKDFCLSINILKGNY